MNIDRFKNMLSNKKIFNLFCIVFITFLNFVFYSEGLNKYFLPDELADLSSIETLNGPLYLGAAANRPVRFALVDFMHSTFGTNPLPYHAVDLSLHIINSLLVLLIVRKITGEGIVGFLASCLFATSWLHAETIVFIAQHDMLLATFSTLYLIFFYRYRVNPTWPSYVMTLFFFILALGSKESVALFLAPLLYLVDRYIVLESEDASIKTNLSRAAYIPFLLLAGIWMYYSLFGYYHLNSFVKANFSVVKTINNFVRSVTFCFSFPFFTESPRFGITNLILLTILYLLSPPQIKSYVSLLMASLVIICLPASSLFSPAPRHLYFPAIFSMAIFIVIFYYGVLQLSRKVRLRESLCKLIVGICISLLVYNNYIFVNKQVKAYVYLSGTYKNILETIAISSLKGTNDTRVIVINYPTSVSKDAFYCISQEDWSSLLLLTGATISEFNLPELWDATSNFWELSNSRTISPTEFEELTMRKGNKVYLFDPKLGSIHDVTGRDLTYAKELINRG